MVHLMRIYCLLLFASSAFAQTSSGTVQGSVTDTPGAGIRGARILVHWDRSGAVVGLRTNVGIKHDMEVQTDNNGDFKLELPAGFYDLFVSADGFSPQSEKIRVNAHSTVRVYPKLPPTLWLQKN